MKNFNRMLSLSLVLGALFQLPASASEGSGGVRGGGDPVKIAQATIELLLTGNGLKTGILNYLKTIQVDQISEPLVKGALTRIMENDALQKDIQTSGNYVIGNNCTDAYSSSVPASTIIGNIGGQICFDTAKIAADFATLTPEDTMIKLASLALHEHVHHFQSPSASSVDNENEAYTVAAYLQLTAKVAQEPILKWVPGFSSSGDSQIFALLDIHSYKKYGQILQLS